MFNKAAQGPNPCTNEYILPTDMHFYIGDQGAKWIFT